MGLTQRQVVSEEAENDTKYSQKEKKKIHEEDLAILNINASNTRTQKFMKEMLHYV